MFTRFTCKSPSRKGLSERDLRRIIGDTKKENARETWGDTLKEEAPHRKCTRGGACVPGDIEGGGGGGEGEGGPATGGWEHEGRHEWESRGATTGSENPEKYVIVSSTVITKNRTNE